MKKAEQIQILFPTHFQFLYDAVESVIDGLQEIRIRVNCPLIFVVQKNEYFIDVRGNITSDFQKAFIMKKADLESVFNHICQYSPYAYDNQICQGYFTVAGGHRIGVCGQVVLDSQTITLMKQICFINIRVSHEIRGIGDSLMPFLYQNGGFENTLIISPPGGGKTTLLRDLAKNISDGNRYAKGKQICIIDERSEVAGCYMGVPQNDVGMRTDVLDGCPKAIGMMMAIRAMGPEVIVVDELGLEKDFKALELASVCGIKILATAHGKGLEDILTDCNQNNEIERKVFERFIVLSWKKNMQGEKVQEWKIYDKQKKLIAEEERI